ncbi:Nonribosomal peptide synthetase 8 [Cercospora beticola]|uniref:Nonribosomal peptide synthetase 8 n=1 Tax=Cercospora beticola TaxID=122368 RepID=A0A2G5HNQ2_CERBT|nr:Nonribosomal peptide synthetase 8 [Cercospora beticola]PIA94174.1 Nonribosomal peptide synthetase 8 [Cercospora beticola]WPB04603.1 hypothetical protein RHO25_009249 [Cercospora beticola]
MAPLMDCEPGLQRDQIDPSQLEKKIEHCSINLSPYHVDKTGLELVSETLPGLLERQVGLTPDALAIDSYEGQWTYSQLQEEMLSLQIYLQNHGVASGARVGILLPLSARAVMAILAIMDIGAAVVPVDLHHPPARQMTIFHESNVELVVSDKRESMLEDFRQEYSVIDLSDLKAGGQEGRGPTGTHAGPLPSNASISSAQPQADAYIAFTSGSTGVPKGIVQSHAAIITMCKAMVAPLEVQASSRIAHVAPYVFDVAMMEIALSFGTGAALCIMSKRDLVMPEPGELEENLNRFKITHFTLSPTMLRSIKVDSVPTMRMLSVMGEPLDRRAVKLWSVSRKSQLRQMWGCTEGTILQSITPPLQSHDEPQNIGSSLYRVCRLWITDPEDVDVLREDGEAGELVVESRALASRYINRPDQTERSFLANVAWKKPSSDTRYYRTGDLARKESDGTVTFLGRQDGQMTIRGERIELGEIDYHIEQAGLLQGRGDCFAEFEPSTQTIVGFVCGHAREPSVSDSPLTLISWEDAAVSKEVLGETMLNLIEEGNLAPQMVPMWWFPLAARPLTISHKTDRARLRTMMGELSHEQWTMYRVVSEDAL